jgi:hypothetical protein
MDASRKGHWHTLGGMRAVDFLRGRWALGSRWTVLGIGLPGPVLLSTHGLWRANGGPPWSRRIHVIR